MRSVKYLKHGGPEVLDIFDDSPPVPAAGEVVVDVHAVSLNPIDWKIRAGRIDGLPAAFPAPTGRDGAGIVTAANGEALQGLVGARVCFLAPRGRGTWADTITLPGEAVVRIPETLPLTEAAALPLVGVSAWTGLVGSGTPLAGSRVLIHGGSGGVGSIAVQLARLLGAHVSATCSAANAEYVRSLGADEVIAYDEAAFEHVVADIDLAFDLIGGDVHRRTYQVIKPGGTLVCLNAAPIEDRSAEFGINLVRAEVLPDRNALAAIVDRATDGSFQSIVHRVLPFEEFRQAHALGENGHGPGKIVLALR